jgi:thermostable 8-oxoguanine DNA glycosylase
MSFFIDPADPIKFDRTDAELETFWLFCLVVAGKTAQTQARLLDNFLSGLWGASAFDRIRQAWQEAVLLIRLQESRLGQYGRLYHAMTQSLEVDLRTCTVDDLEAIHGVGPKTARMFLMMSRPDQEYAALDTHVLKHLRANGIPAPKATPPAGPTYQRLEQAFIGLAKKSGMSVVDYDLNVWKQYAR